MRVFYSRLRLHKPTIPYKWIESCSLPFTTTSARFACRVYFTRQTTSRLSLIHPLNSTSSHHKHHQHSAFRGRVLKHRHTHRFSPYPTSPTLAHMRSYFHLAPSSRRQMPKTVRHSFDFNAMKWTWDIVSNVPHDDFAAHIVHHTHPYTG